jgi:hypothetical protein
VVSATDPRGRNTGFLDPEPLLFHSSSSSVILTRLRWGECYEDKNSRRIRRTRLYTWMGEKESADAVSTDKSEGSSWEDNTVTCYLGSQPIRRSIARQQLPRNNGSAVGIGVFYVVRPDAISRQ